VPFINLKGFIIANGVTDYSVDGYPSFPATVYNFHLIMKEVYDTFENNDCFYSLFDLIPHNNSQVCEAAWNKINELTSHLYMCDLFRPVPGMGVGSSDEHKDYDSIMWNLNI
jgi:hypothetical protein